MAKQSRIDSTKWDMFVRRLPKLLVTESGPAAVKRIGIEAFNRIVKRTPVDTGRARAGWQFETGQVRSKLMVEITNDVPYVIYLEYGKSGQAPRGMVRVTLAELIATGLIKGEGAAALLDAAKKAGAI